MTVSCGCSRTQRLAMVGCERSVPCIAVQRVVACAAEEAVVAGRCARHSSYNRLSVAVQVVAAGAAEKRVVARQGYWRRWTAHRQKAGRPQRLFA
jgi:hypothetical protein